jgi:hypothetical protein
MTTKTIDGRGRLTLGPAFANRMVLVEELEGGIVQLIPAEAVPAREAWLFKNRKALAAVLVGLEQARKGEFAPPPELVPDEDEAEGKS